MKSEYVPGDTEPKEVIDLGAIPEPHIRIIDLLNMGEYVEVLLSGKIEIGCFHDPPADFQDYPALCPPRIRVYAEKGSDEAVSIQLNDRNISEYHGTLRRGQFEEIFYDDHSDIGTAKSEHGSKSKEAFNNASVMLAPGDSLYFGRGFGEFRLELFLKGPR